VVRVERVVVHEGGQAIVGNVGPGAPRGGGGGRDELERSQEPRAPPARLARDAAAGARKWSGSSVSSSMKAVRRSWAMWAPEHHGVAGGRDELERSQEPRAPPARLARDAAARAQRPDAERKPVPAAPASSRPC
jgi:hypothetical protein